VTQTVLCYFDVTKAVNAKGRENNASKEVRADFPSWISSGEVGLGSEGSTDRRVDGLPSSSTSASGANTLLKAFSPNRAKSPRPSNLAVRGE